MRLALIVATATLVAVMGGDRPDGPAEVPCAAFLAAGLRQQEALASGRLELWCTVRATSGTNDETLTSDAYRYHYIRTPDLRAGEATWHGTLEKARYSRSDHELLVLRQPTGEGRCDVVRSYTHIQGLLLNAHAVDVPLYTLGNGQPIAGVMVQAGVVVGIEQVDGEDCWRVDASLAEGATCSVWLDPQIGFCPRLIAESDSFASGTCAYRGYSPRDDGVWVPAEIEQVTIFRRPPPGVDADELRVERRLAVDRVRVGDAADAAWAEISIPEDAQVRPGADGDIIYTFSVDVPQADGNGSASESDD